MLARGAGRRRGYIALVASRRRAAGVLAELGATDDERARIHAPAGLDIGARSAAEIALSVCAGIVAARPRVARLAERPAAAGPAVAVDPICGMEVLVEDGAAAGGRRVLLRPGLPRRLAGPRPVTARACCDWVAGRCPCCNWGRLATVPAAPSTVTVWPVCRRARRVGHADDRRDAVLPRDHGAV